jgi:hypothetical protein
VKVSRNTSAKGNESPGRTARPAQNTRGSAKKTGQQESEQENRQKLGVESDHRTPAMRKGHRGTFP